MAATKPTRGEDYEETFDALEERLQDDAEARREFLDGVRASMARVDLEETLEDAGVDVAEFLAVADTEEGLRSVGPADEDALEALLLGESERLGAGTQGPIEFDREMFGLRVTVTEPAMKEMREAEDMVRAFMALGGAAAAAGGPVALAVVGLFAAYVNAEWEAMKYVDNGRGVYLHNTYATPGLIWPTAI
jgi:hypothetical protein